MNANGINIEKSLYVPVAFVSSIFPIFLIQR